MGLSEVLVKVPLQIEGVCPQMVVRGVGPGRLQLAAVRAPALLVPDEEPRAANSLSLAERRKGVGAC